MCDFKTHLLSSLWYIVGSYDAEFESCFYRYEGTVLCKIDIKAGRTSLEDELVSKYSVCRARFNETHSAHIWTNKYSMCWGAERSSLLLLQFVWKFFPEDKLKYPFSLLCLKYNVRPEDASLITAETLRCVRFLVEDAGYPWPLTCDGMWSLWTRPWNTTAIRELVAYMYIKGEYYRHVSCGIFGHTKTGTDIKTVVRDALLTNPLLFVPSHIQ